MLSTRILLRHVHKGAGNNVVYKCLSQAYSSKSDSDSDNEKRKRKPSTKIAQENKVKSDVALKKLNILLKQMIEDDTQVPSKSELNLAKPKPKTRNAKLEPGTVSAKTDPVDKQIVSAAKDVAQSLGGNVKQTESELLSKLLHPESSTNQEDTIPKSPVNLSDIIAGMKIDRTVKPAANINEASRAHQVRQLLDRTAGKTSKEKGTRDRRTFGKGPRTPFVPKTEIRRVDLFGSEPLGIFTSKPSEKIEEQTTLHTWNSLHNREMRLAVTHPPENYFQEMILWTQQGKVWKFPIDNEQGMEEEQNVYFAEHIFLDKYLENWCPTKGPIRHFMELVCVGLSKNPYLSAKAKEEHILWFRDYFLSKKQLLEEIGAMPTATTKTNEISEK